MAPVTTTSSGLDRRQIPGLPGVTIPGLTLPIPGFPGVETGSTSTTASTVTTPTVLPTTPTTTTSITTTTTTETTISSTSTVPTISTPTALPTSTPDPEPTVPPPSTPSFPPVLPTVSTPSTTLSTPSASSTSIGNTKTVPTKGFFANTAAVTATFTILGVIVVAVFLYFLTMALRRRRVERLERDIAEAAAIQAGFGGDFAGDDDRRPFGASGMAASGAGSSSLTSHPSMRTTHSQPISTGPSAYGNLYPGYAAQPQSQARYSPPSAYAGGYNMQQPPRTTSTPPRHDEPDVYAYNSGASSDSAHVPTMAGVGTQGAGGYGSAMVPGISRYAQMQAAAQPQQLNRSQSTRKESTPTPPPPVATPMRKDSAISVQQVGGYDGYRDHAVATDLKVVNS